MPSKADAKDVTQEENNKQQLHPMLEQTKANREAIGIKEKTDVTLADTGYCSDENFTKMLAGDVELLVAVQKDYKQRKAIQEQPPPEEPIPDGLSPMELMEWKLLTDRVVAVDCIRFEVKRSSRCLDKLRMLAVLTSL